MMRAWLLIFALLFSLGARAALGPNDVTKNSRQEWKPAESVSTWLTSKSGAVNWFYQYVKTANNSNPPAAWASMTYAGDFASYSAALAAGAIASGKSYSYGTSAGFYNNQGSTWTTSLQSRNVSYCPENSTEKDASTCTCTSGYKPNESATACVVSIVCPPDQYATTNQQTGVAMCANRCEAPAVWDQTAGQCSCSGQKGKVASENIISIRPGASTAGVHSCWGMCGTVSSLSFVKNFISSGNKYSAYRETRIYTGGTTSGAQNCAATVAPPAVPAPLPNGLPPNAQISTEKTADNQPKVPESTCASGQTLIKRPDGYEACATSYGEVKADNTGTSEKPPADTVKTTNPDGTTKEVTTQKNADGSTTTITVDRAADGTVTRTAVTGAGSAGAAADTGTTEHANFCKENPDAIACQKLGNAGDGDAIENKQVSFSVDPLTFGGGSSCPGNKVVQLSFMSLPLNFQPLCDLANFIKPVTLAIAWLIAAGIISGSLREA